MKLHRFYQDVCFDAEQTIELSSSVSNHISRVLRLKQGAQVCLFNGRDEECLATVEAINKKSVMVALVKPSEVSRESSLNLTLVQAISKGERFDWLVQKAVELGVSQLVPVITERNVVKIDTRRQEKKHAHWQRIIENASEQCGRNTLMQVSPIVSLSEYLQQKPSGLHGFLTPIAGQRIHELPQDCLNATFYIGPEGGFTEQEAIKFSEHQALPLNLGKRILRTETAGIVIAALAQAYWGDL